jgi:8-oxo-dGTP diphosphatase
VKALLLDPAGRTLLIRRSPASRHFAGAWEWPGGKVDPGEDFAAAVRREALEETGLDVEVTGFAGAVGFEMPKAHVVMLFMEARLAGGTLALSGEHDAAEWAPLGGLAGFALADQVRAFMLDYAGKRAGGA